MPTPEDIENWNLEEEDKIEEVAKAHEELARGERTATALEEGLNKLELKIEDLLAAAHASRAAAAAGKSDPSQAAAAATKAPPSSVDTETLVDKDKDEKQADEKQSYKAHDDGCVDEKKPYGSSSNEKRA